MYFQFSRRSETGPVIRERSDLKETVGKVVKKMGLFEAAGGVFVPKIKRRYEEGVGLQCYFGITGANDNG
jgi:hypothetical protein